MVDIASHARGDHVVGFVVVELHHSDPVPMQRGVQDWQVGERIRVGIRERRLVVRLDKAASFRSTDSIEDGDTLNVLLDMPHCGAKQCKEAEYHRAILAATGPDAGREAERSAMQQ